MNFDKGLKIVSATRKLIFKVPASDVVVAFEQDMEVSGYGQNNDRPVILVLNETDGDGDGTWQGADGEKGVVILNEVPGEIAEALLDMMETPPTVDNLDDILIAAGEQGCGDQYTADTDFVDDHLSPAGRMVDDYTGIVKRDEKDVVLAIRDKEGVIRIKLPNGDERHIEEDILLRTYRGADGSPIDLSDIPTADAE
ncbi:hypothetical protein HOA55_02775 [archaeon]|nr:hypothetical protein [archaeon]MBT6820253.1 hypothetical protein [archaeon]MBT6956716.1 hypothetical protein [archaeon]MBT7025457.1 hypothetical protein [archaeon]MBT7239307.1 hypothetical protein [archaeon]